MTFIAKIIFVSASWCPVYLLVGTLTWSTRPLLAKCLLAAAAASALSLWAVKATVERWFAEELLTVASARAKQDDIFMYILTYLPPFFAADLSSMPKLLAITILYLFIFVTYVRMDLYHLNPLFVFFGYRVFEVETSSGRRLHVIAKAGQLVRAGEQVRVAMYADIALLSHRGPR